ncbi:hypothetical protein Bxe_A2803 [Paraburkholderia xenovorans LB400]|uniref:Uncharacterized protein n=1 Tax=Paraburkholderia xenovorans (strain LB400) TaxID=266265 RepID=Q140S9_PARXL|nr:hypothetical protein Bxe_A2803 [Paraburkholderia xenovorans LB400]
MPVSARAVPFQPGNAEDFFGVSRRALSNKALREIDGISTESESAHKMRCAGRLRERRNVTSRSRRYDVRRNAVARKHIRALETFCSNK